MVGSSERRQREKDTLRAAILDAARELFATQGYEAVTMRKIADRIEFSPTAIYQHFADKETLVTELCNVDFLDLAVQLRGLLDVPDPIERLSRLAAAFVRFSIEFPNHYRFLFMTTHAAYDEAVKAERAGNPRLDGYALLRMTCDQAIQQGKLREDIEDADLAAQVAWGAIHGPIALQLTIRRPERDWIEWRPVEEICRVAAAAIIRGMQR